MGSNQYFKRAKSGKVDSPLNKILESIEWGEFRLGNLFEKVKTKKLSFKANELPKQRIGEYTLPCLTSSFQNQGLNYFVPRDGATILKNVISIPSNSDVYRAYFQSNEFTILSDAYAIQWIFNDTKLSAKQYLFLVQCINKVTDLPIYSYKNKLGGWNIVKNKNIQLPIKDNQIDFEFMEKFIAKLETERIDELEAYLLANNLKDYTLKKEEKEVLDDFENERFIWEEFNLKKMFGESSRGKRLKSNDRVLGDLPFVTAGETNEGVSGFIGNTVSIFSKNTVTIDMFGSAKYRNYEYGADDHITVVHTEKLSKFASIFIASSIHQASYTGEFHYGKNFYPKDADNLNIFLPTNNQQADYKLMEILISAIQKLVIKDVVLYVDKKRCESKVC